MTDADSVKAIGQADMRAALISISTIGVAVGLIWWFGGRQLFESARLAEQTSQAQQSASERIGQQEQWIGRIQNNLTAMQESLDESLVSPPDAQAMQQRLGELERQLEGLPQLTDRVRKELSLRTTQRARDAAQLVAIVATIHKCQTELDIAEKFVGTWHADYATLLTDGRGQRIASDTSAVARLATILNDVQWEAADIDAWRQELHVAAEPYLQAADDPAVFEVNAEDTAYFEQFLTRVTAANQGLRKREQLVQGEIVAAATRELGQQTLQQAMESAEYNAVQAMLEQATQQRLTKLKTYVAEQSEKIQRAEEERLAALTQVELAKREAARAEYDQEQQEIESGIAQRNAATRRRQLEAEFQQDQAEIKSLLSPFLGSSDRQPTVGTEDDPSSWIVVSNPMGPVSFGRLQGSRALDDTLDGKRRLHFIGGSPMSFRRTGSFPAYSRTGFNSPAVIRQLERAQELLLKYGDLLVEKGMLRR